MTTESKTNPFPPLRAPGRVRDALLLAGLGLLAACHSGASSLKPANGTSASSASPLLTPEVYLEARVFQIPAQTFNNPQPITMWGYSRCTAGFASCAAPTVPGPSLNIPAGRPFTVHLRNALTGPYVEPVSVIVPGQTAAMTPVWIDPATQEVTSQGARAPGDYQSRVRSFTAETPPGGTTETVYTWTNPREGTYLYQSGTHPSVQVQMGLFGALRVYPATSGLAYVDPSTAFDSEVTLVLSEVDPVLHQAVALGHYGPNPNDPEPPPAGWLTSTVGYRPQYFLINGKGYAPTAAAIPAGLPGGRLLLRFLNAGLETKVPVVGGAYMSILAEDGNFASVTLASGAKTPAPRQQYALLLPAGKTMDALMRPAQAGTLAVYDRRFNLTNAGVSPGGMLAFLSVGAPAAVLAEVRP